MNTRYALPFALIATVAIAAGPARAALSVGSTAPDFSAEAALAGKTFPFSLSGALKKGPVVLYFFPAAFTPGCTAEAHAFAEATADFNKLGATVVGVTAGNVDRVAEFSKVECRDKFAVIADPGAKIARTYKSMLALRPGWSDRTSYVIARDGKVAAVYSNLDPSRHVETSLSEVRKLQPGM